MPLGASPPRVAPLHVLVVSFVTVNLGFERLQSIRII